MVIPNLPATATQILTGTDKFSPIVSYDLASVPAWQTLTFVGGGTSTWAKSGGVNAKLTLTASTTTIGNPSGLSDGDTVQLKLCQGGSGSYTVTWGSVYDFGTAGQPTLTTTVNYGDLVTCSTDVSNATLKLACGVVKGVSCQ